MNVRTVNISFQPDLLSEIDKMARSESRSRSEVLREAARLYVDRKRRWDRIFEIGAAATKRRKLTEDDVVREIHAHRREKTKSR